MNTLWDSKILARITKGELNKDWTVSGFSIDTRSLKKGDIFCALKGTKQDGHIYLEDAFKKGAKSALISKSTKAVNGLPYLKVDNVLDALQKIAKQARLNSNAKFIGITGSVGKTGTKEMLRTAFNNIEEIYASEGNLNNHIGVPLSLCRMPKKTKICILELGMNKEGEIKKLSEICRPDTAIITAIENSHLKGLKTLRKIAEAKSEILLNLPKDGCCIFNLDTNYSELIYQKAKALKLKNIITYGRKNGANIKLQKIKVKENEYIIEASIFNKKVNWSMPKIGEHWVLNCLSVIAAAYFYKYDLNKVIKAIKTYKVPNGRGNKSRYNFKNKSFTMIDDSYNSSPASLKASLIYLKNTNSNGRKIAVLGDMMELGEKSLRHHLKLKDILLQTGVKVLFTKGRYMKELSKEMPSYVAKYHFDDIGELSNKFKKIISNEDIVLLKGSNANGLFKIIENLKEEIE